MATASFENVAQTRPLLSEEEQDAYAQERNKVSDYIPVYRRLWFVVALCCIAVVGVVVVAAGTIIYVRPSTVHKSASSSQSCQNPSVRREWRTLSTDEKLAYLDAVVCLTKTPSVIGRNQTVFEDFPWTHNNKGMSAHYAAPFLAWHRYFLHVYEAKLRDVCHYSGSLVFFDWQLNVHDLPAAPIWDPITGFGGDGNATGVRTVNTASCVTDGPFANLQVQYYADEAKPHCLSRGFQAPDDMEKYYSARVSDDAIANIMAMPEYNAFNLGMENGPHLAMPHGVLGDFFSDTAPNDPVFFLHHAQLDRLWWKWQHAEPGRRREYNGASSRHSKEAASLQDQLEMGTLAPKIAVEEVIDTQSGILCYEYAY
ncbi:Tyrosinase [Lachnellula subtilissima]|uniref:Tyrosinase n=1 Tax=Lachnellula subtilissima TaxID=602034 RepID=A0A8H8RL10_9HELO|nr:Tyrosinase [Lachnellula subtilissima]